jgi:hypothetical protein
MLKSSNGRDWLHEKAPGSLLTGGYLEFLVRALSSHGDGIVIAIAD